MVEGDNLFLAITVVLMFCVGIWTGNVFADKGLNLNDWQCTERIQLPVEESNAAVAEIKLQCIKYERKSK